jgi:hypothetical protein
MEILVKETATLHKVLSRYLAPIVVEVRDILSFLSASGRRPFVGTLAVLHVRRPI